MVRIVVDSAADMPPALIAAHGITQVPVLIQLGDQTLRDGLDLSRDTFYQRLAESVTLPKTAAPPVGAFATAFEGLLSQGDEVLSLSIAGAQSATYGAARQAAALLGGRVACVDTQTISLPIGLLAAELATAARAGLPLEALVALAEARRARAVLLFALDTLHYLEKGGRIGRARALLGSLLDVKPILEMSGAEMHPVAQVRAARRVPARLVELAAERGDYAALGVLYTTGRAQAEELADRCAAAGLLPRDQIVVAQVSAGLGAHAGPGALGVAGLLR